MRNIADPIKVDSADPADAMGQLAVLLLALFAQMERTYTCERAAQLRDAGDSMAQIVAKTGMTRSSLYRYLPPRRPLPVMAAQRAEDVTVEPAGTATADAAVVGAA